MENEFLYGAVILIAIVFFGWRVRKSIIILSQSRNDPKLKMPILEWLYIAMAISLVALFGLSSAGIL